MTKPATRHLPKIVIMDALCRHWIKRAFDTFYFVPFQAVEDAPETFKDLKAWADAHGFDPETRKHNPVMPVYAGGSDATISGSAEGNHVFRAWHDCIHLQHGLGFSKADELAVAAIHCEQLRAIRAPQSVINAVWCDAAGQVLHYYKYRKFVKDQAAFVEECLNTGIHYALKRCWA